MIGRLTGHVDDGDGSTVIVDVHGVGYEVHVPLGTRGRVVTDSAGRQTLHIHTHVREDALLLYGFASESERSVFRTLTSVSNVGPKLALAILGALDPPTLARAVALRDAKALTSVPGVGKKIAETILFELKDKSLAADAATSPTEASAPRPTTGKAPLVVSALVHLGYKSADAERAVAALDPLDDDAPVPQLIKDALSRLAR
jgi:Holliday junction DNA helicase RuvA